MQLELKKSQITDWWVAESNLKLAFVDILSEQCLKENLFVVGYLDKEKKELATSSNRVVEVTKNGVITAKGTFYPFEEAHQLYLHFLIEVHKENTLIATNWKYKEKWGKRTIIADIIRNGKIEKGVSFDFIPKKNYNVTFAGYSSDLGSNVVITTFARRDVCIKLEIPKSVELDIFCSSLILPEEKQEKIGLIQNIFEEKFQ